MSKIKIGLILLELERIGCKKVVIEYSGGGDNGAIDRIILDEDEKVNKKLAKKLVNWDDFEQAIQDWCYKRLEGLSNWYDNDGGQGTVTLNIPLGNYVIDHEINTTHVDAENEEGDILDTINDD